jgi:hypothetical protein
MARFIPFLITTVVVLVSLGLMVTVQRSPVLRSRLGGLVRRQRLEATPGEIAGER